MKRNETKRKSLKNLKSMMKKKRITGKLKRKKNTLRKEERRKKRRNKILRSIKERKSFKSQKRRNMEKQFTSWLRHNLISDRRKILRKLSKWYSNLGYDALQRWNSVFRRILLELFPWFRNFN